MKIFVFFLAFQVLGTLVASAEPPTFELHLYSDQKRSYQKIRIIEFQNLKVTKSCLGSDGKMKCLAWGAIQKKVKDLSPTTPLLGNPAARYCLANGANNRILLDLKKREFDYCVFSDGSMIDAWSLFNKHHQEKRE